MDGQPVKEVVKEKDLGVVFTKDLKTAENCNEAYSKANRTLGLISIGHKVEKSHDTTQFVQVISQTYHVFITAQLSGILNARKISSC